MSVNVNGKNIFTKEMANVFQAEVIECPDCAFEFATKHEESDSSGCYSCPACREAELEIERNRLKGILDELRELSQKEINFGEALFEQGDRANGHFREGFGRGILKAVCTIEKLL